jgi:hypothetical protein
MPGRFDPRTHVKVWDPITQAWLRPNTFEMLTGPRAHLLVRMVEDHLKKVAPR